MVSIVRKVQLIQLQILQEFMQICQRHNLRWYMIGGSLIGVLRHKGFIPWDDDIDIGMPRKDYERFLALQKEYPKGYVLTNHKSDKMWQFNFSQFVDNESEIIVHMNEQPRYCKVWIDVFPLDGLPSNRFLRWLHGKRILMYRYLVQIPNLKTQVDTHKVGRPWYEKLIIRVLHFIPIGNLINVEWGLSAMERTLKKHDFDQSQWVGNLLGKYREREYMPKEWWGTPVLLPYEGIFVYCPEYADKIETKLYGDYMKWPKEANRVSHDIEIVKLRIFDE